MEWLVVPLVALIASGLTFFSGFGLGTLLLPAFALFFPVSVAVALTAVVHMLNNVFKLALVGRHADRGAILRFGLPAILGSFAGAALLIGLSKLPALFAYELAGHRFDVYLVKIVVAGLMIAFAMLEVLPRFQHLAFQPRHLPLGGLLSGFFGGLSGHQGALRSAFLVRSGLSKEAFVATGVVLAVLVDLARLTVYASYLTRMDVPQHGPLLATATGAAFLGAMLGNRLLEKVTLRNIQVMVSGMLVVLGVLLGLGMI